MTTTAGTTGTTSTTSTTGWAADAGSQEEPATFDRIPLSRIVGVELRKMFDTRSGLWLMASIVITALLSASAIVAFADDADLTYYTFSKAIGFPMSVILPIIAVLAITGEWSQRTGLITFTLVPQRYRVVLAKVVASVVVGVAAMVCALAFGIAGNLVGPAIAGTDRVWDVTVGHFLTIVLASLLCLLAGTMLGVLFRSSTVALVTYFVYAFAVPSLLGLWASRQEGFADLRPWVDLVGAEGLLFEGTPTGVQWAQVGVTAALWILLPALLGLRLIMRSEVR